MIVDFFFSFNKTFLALYSIHFKSTGSFSKKTDVLGSSLCTSLTNPSEVPSASFSSFFFNRLRDTRDTHGYAIRRPSRTLRRSRTVVLLNLAGINKRSCAGEEQVANRELCDVLRPFSFWIETSVTFPRSTSREFGPLPAQR